MKPALTQVSLQDRGDIVLERRCARDLGAGEPGVSESAAQGVGVGRGLLQVERRASHSAVGDPESLLQSRGTACGHCSCGTGEVAVEGAKPGGRRVLDTEDHREGPFMFSPKCRSRIVFASCEPFPGTASEVESSSGSRTVESVPTMTRAIHATRSQRLASG